MKKKICALSTVFTLSLMFLSLTGCNQLPVNSDPDLLIYKDACNKIHTVPVNHEVPKNQYKKELFKRKGYKMAYTDPAYTYRLGLDISRHDGKIDWKKVKNAGYEFIIFRIGWRGYQSGILHVDENFHENIKGALQEGFDIGVYVFSQAINEEEAIEEAELVINELKEYEIQLPVVFDPESIPWEEARTDEITGEQFTKNTLAFCKKIEAAGYTPMIYSNLIWETEFFDLSSLKDYKIWYADYFKKPQTPYHFEFWQYGGEWAKVPGIKRKVDVDIQLIPVENN